MNTFYYYCNLHKCQM